MSGQEIFDAVIIGAGPAGAACAYTLAKAGREVVIIERGDTAGSKNLTGGRLYAYALEQLEAGLCREAQLERAITREQIMLLGEQSGVTIDYYDPSRQQTDPPLSYTVLRANFDQWLAEKAEDQGAMLACGIKVDNLIEKSGQIVGVVAGEDEMYARVVVAADGVNSLIARQAGLRQEIDPHTTGIGVKEVIELPASVIEQRFNLGGPEEGAARLMLGCTQGIHGGGFLYTNRDSVSLGAVFMPQELAAKKLSIHTIFQEMKMHPAIYPLLAEGKTIEYGAHLVPESGHRGLLSPMYRDGLLVVGDAAGFVMNLGYTIRGIDFAILSGIAAARAILNASANSSIGPQYEQELEKIKLLSILKALDGYNNVLDTPWMYDKLPLFANDVFRQLFNVTGATPTKMTKDVKGALKANGISVWDLLKLGIKGVKAL